MEDFKMLMDKTIGVFSTQISIWGYSFSFWEVVLFLAFTAITVRVVAAVLFDE